MLSFDINEIQRELTCIAIALRDLADVRTYDLWILGVGMATFIASTAMAFFSYRLNKKQSDILEQQNNIALFDKRYELYAVFKDLKQSITLVYTLAHNIEKGLTLNNNNNMTAEEINTEICKRKYISLSYLAGCSEILDRNDDFDKCKQEMTRELSNAFREKENKLLSIFYIFDLNENYAQLLRNILENMMFASSIIFSDELNIDFKKEITELHTGLHNKELDQVLKQQLVLYKK